MVNNIIFVALHHTERLQLLNSWKEQSTGMEVFLYGLKNWFSKVIFFCMSDNSFQQLYSLRPCKSPAPHTEREAATFKKVEEVLRIRIRDPVPYWPLDQPDEQPETYYR